MSILDKGGYQKEDKNIGLRYHNLSDDISSEELCSDQITALDEIINESLQIFQYEHPSIEEKSKILNILNELHSNTKRPWTFQNKVYLCRNFHLVNSCICSHCRTNMAQIAFECKCNYCRDCLNSLNFTEVCMGCKRKLSKNDINALIEEFT